MLTEGVTSTIGEFNRTENSNFQIEEIMGTLGDLESLFGDVEISLLGLEDTIDAREMQEKQLDQRFQVALYQERRKAEFNDLSGTYYAYVEFPMLNFFNNRA